MFSAQLLNQLGLISGFAGAVLLFFAEKKGVLTKDGAIFTGLNPYDNAEKNLQIVKRSHWRNRWFTPIGWAWIALSFVAQFIATLLPGG